MHMAAKEKNTWQTISFMDHQNQREHVANQERSWLLQDIRNGQGREKGISKFKKKKIKGFRGEN